MSLPKFLLADHSQFPDTVYVLHTEYPRFLLNVTNDEVTWFESFDQEDLDELEEASIVLIDEALSFYDSEMEQFDA
ncbi:MAG: hypothetical protein VW236_05460 [Flavobacteriaceae bacterium]|jgi:hypothetical protein